MPRYLYSKMVLFYPSSMFRFLFSHISSSWIRSLSIVLASFLTWFIGVIFYIIYLNISSAIGYYILDDVDEKRFSITAGTTIFQLFDREKWGISANTLKRIENDRDIERYREFRFIDISVVWKFDIFDFDLATDIPTFSVSDGWDKDTGVGISKNMLKYYNLEFAWSHALFPVLSDMDIVGTSVTLFFGASKVFTQPEKNENAYISKITHVDADYPGFWVVIPFSIAEKEMAKLWLVQNAPYKIVWYMIDTSRRSEIESRYSDYVLRFDTDTIREQRQALTTVARTLISMLISILIILYGFLFLLFTGYFRERGFIGALISQYKIRGIGKYMLLYLEWSLLISIGCIVGIIIWLSTQWFLLEMVGGFFRERQIFFSIVHASVVMTVSIYVWSFLVSVLLFLIARHISKK